MNLDIGLMTFDLQAVPGYARRAEEIGFGAIWSAETRARSVPAAGGRLHHHVARRARHRDRGGVPAQPHDPGPHRVGSAEGLGRPLRPRPGPQVKAHNERRFSVAWEPPGPRLREVVQALRAIWDCWQRGHAARLPRALLPLRSHDALLQPGAHRASAHPDLPGRGEPADVPGSRARSRTGCTSIPSTARGYLREVRAPRGAGGAQPRRVARAPDFTFRASTMVVLGDTEEELERNARAVKQQIAFYASTRTYQAVLAVHGLEHLVPRLHAKTLAGDWEGMADLISDETLDLFAVSGPCETIGRAHPRALSRPLRPHPAATRPSSPCSTIHAGPPSSTASRAREGLCYNPNARGDRHGHPEGRASRTSRCFARSPRPSPSSEIRSAETQRLIDDMVETMREYNGAGLAATQVHALKQICVIEVHGNPRYPGRARHPAHRPHQPGGDPAHRRDGRRLGGLPLRARHARHGPALHRGAARGATTARASRSTWWPRSSSPA